MMYRIIENSNGHPTEGHEVVKATRCHTKKVTKSHIPAENVPARLEVPEATLTQSEASESQIRWKRGRPLGSKDANPRKRKEHIVSINHDAKVTTSNVSKDKIPEVILSEDPKRNEQDLDEL
ncbi:hypothetical protein Sango_2903800 [Sesamum angolense]|uniref:Uncharacterized protein n=1 Tax=Sesamum angolense TaxID=2727404 RepID=A0AAE1T6H9_9LAMI|nr:hypothetical protein Sango_2903800 [Sesamum angolense]